MYILLTFGPEVSWITESLLLEKTTETILSKHQPITHHEQHMGLSFTGEEVMMLPGFSVQLINAEWLLPQTTNLNLWSGAASSRGHSDRSEYLIFISRMICFSVGGILKNSYSSTLWRACKSSLDFHLFLIQLWHVALLNLIILL